MEKIKEKVSNWLGFFKDHIQSFNVVAKEKNVVYFSKFTLESEDFYEIHNFVIKLKQNLLRGLIGQFKFAIYNIISFNDKNLSERDKIMTIYSACFLNYYRKFLYDTSHEFEEFFDQSFLGLVKTFNVEIKNIDLFKALSFSFFNKMKEEIIKSDYEKKIKPMKDVYNPKLKNKDNAQIINTLFNSENNNNLIINQNNNINEGYKVKDKAISYVISAKEKIVDIIYEIKYRNLFPHIFCNQTTINNNINSRFNQMYNISAQNLENLYKTLEKEKINYDDLNDRENINMSLYDNKTSADLTESLNNSINLNNSFNSINKLNEISNSDSFQRNMDFINDIKNINKKPNDINNINNINTSNSINNFNKFNLINPNNNENKIKINENSAFRPSNPNNIIINNSQDKYSHRVMDELITNKIDDKTMEIITQVAKKIDEEYLDFLLNNSTKPILIFQYFSCYIATFTPKMLQNIDPNNAKILENINIKFIILARESYNIAMELFCSIYDLTATDINRFLDLANICGMHVQYAKGIYKVLCDYSLFLLEENAFLNLKKTVDKFIEMEKVNWDKVIKSQNNIVFFNKK
jgi:hypothetical protein